MTRHLFKLFLLSLLCAAWPGRVGAETLGLQAACLTNRATQGQTANAPKVTAKNWNKPTEATKFEEAMAWLFLYLFVLSIFIVILSLIGGFSVFVPLLIMVGSALGLFIISCIERARERKNNKKSSTAPAKK